MKLFRALGLIIFLWSTKTILLSGAYYEFEQTLSQFFRTTRSGLIKSEQAFLPNESSGYQFNSQEILATPVINFLE